MLNSATFLNTVGRCLQELPSVNSGSVVRFTTVPKRGGGGEYTRYLPNNEVEILWIRILTTPILAFDGLWYRRYPDGEPFHD